MLITTAHIEVANLFAGVDNDKINIVYDKDATETVIVLSNEDITNDLLPFLKSTTYKALRRLL